MEHTNVKILAISDVPSKALWDPLKVLAGYLEADGVR